MKLFRVYLPENLRTRRCPWILVEADAQEAVAKSHPNATRIARAFDSRHPRERAAA